MAHSRLYPQRRAWSRTWPPPSWTSRTWSGVGASTSECRPPAGPPPPADMQVSFPFQSRNRQSLGCRSVSGSGRQTVSEGWPLSPSPAHPPGSRGLVFRAWPRPSGVCRRLLCAPGLQLPLPRRPTWKRAEGSRSHGLLSGDPLPGMSTRPRRPEWCPPEDAAPAWLQRVASEAASRPGRLPRLGPRAAHVLSLRAPGCARTTSPGT